MLLRSLKRAPGAPSNLVAKSKLSPVSRSVARKFIFLLIVQIYLEVNLPQVVQVYFFIAIAYS